jgi:hypothetical protein
VAQVRLDQALGTRSAIGSECGEPLDVGHVAPTPGPGGRTAPGTALIATVLT